MKIRLLGNSLRLRLSQPEVKTLQEQGLVMEAIHFGNGESQRLVYEIKAAGKGVVSAKYQNNSITVELPGDLIQEWANSDLISIKKEMEIGNEQTLNILVEKDFKCLSTDRAEDESDLFPNPKSGSEVC